jgi:hypothetical protein
VDQLAPSHVPLYGTREEGRTVWTRCRERGLPAIAVRDASRGFVVRYDLSPAGRELFDRALAALRADLRRYRRADGVHGPPGVHSQSETVALGDEVGPVTGDFHDRTERRTRRLASRVSPTVLDRDSWR